MANPTQSEVKRRQRQAWAPYNFVPLPDQAITAPTLEEQLAHHDEFGLPDHARYYSERFNGRIDCTLTTLSPFYTRCAVQPGFFEKWGKALEEISSDEEAQKEYAKFFHHGEVTQPVIPGSSIRGMVRTLLEIVAHGHMRWVGDNPTFTFRAVAAQRQDPLRQPYENVIGKFGSNVQAGYLEHHSGQWYIQPALTPADLGWKTRDKAYLKIKEKDIPAGMIKRLQRFNSPDYKISWHPVHFNVATVAGSIRVTEIADYGAAYRNVGVLVCSGNMMETQQSGAKSEKESPRQSHALMLAPKRKDRNGNRIEPIPIDEQAVKDYLDGLTDTQKKLEDWSGDVGRGCLHEGAPVFYTAEKDEKNKMVVRYFGHSPNFRIPARLEDSTRASTPVDFVPAALKAGEQPDLAEAIFGWVNDPTQPIKGQRASRVFFSDAKFDKADQGLWLDVQPIALHTLSSPKPTTFQHYLTQDSQQGHSPDELATLAHFGSSPKTTSIRGYKLYWSKGENPPIRASNEELKHPKQLTKARPIKPNVHFDFSVRFENLSKVELGALLWVLALPGLTDRKYCHRLGMGKPLGMGVISIQPQLSLDDRNERYTKLFSSEQWHTASSSANNSEFVAAFERFVLDQTKSTSKSLLDLPRIQTLLTLLEWRSGDAKWLEMTRYMEIEQGSEKNNEYKERPVLPFPEQVVRIYQERGGVAQSQPNVATQRNPSNHMQPTVIEPIPRSENYFEGVVASFGHGAKQNYGFIKYQSGEGKQEDIFVHLNQVDKSVGTLRKGQRVRFVIGKGPNGPAAKQVQLVK